MKVILPRFPWSVTLEEFARPLQIILDEIAPDAPGEVWLGAHHPEVTPPEGAILYQTELPGHTWFTAKYREKLARARAVWDYSRTNAGKYICRAWAHVPLRYHTSLETVVLGPPEIPIGFLGSMSDRRREILLGGPIKAEIMPTQFGADRDAWLARVGMVVVPHYVAGCTVPQNRIGHCLANGIAVVAEAAPDWYDYPGPVYTEAGTLMQVAQDYSYFARTTGAVQRATYIAAGTAHDEVRRALEISP